MITCEHQGGHIETDTHLGHAKSEAKQCSCKAALDHTQVVLLGGRNRLL